MSDNLPITTSSSNKKQRSAAYPSISISQGVDITKKIYTELGSSSFSPRETIAKIFNRSISSMLTDLSSCVQYGLLDMKSKEGYKPTDLFKRISKPLPGEDTNLHLVDCMMCSGLYENLIRDLSDEVVPNTIGLSNILVRKYGITEKAAETAANVFLTNVKDLNLTDSDNHLTIHVDLNTDPEVYTPSGEKHLNEKLHAATSKKNEPTHFSKPLLLNIPTNVTEIGVPLLSGKLVKLIIANDLDDNEKEITAKFLTAVLSSLKGSSTT